MNNILGLSSVDSRQDSIQDQLVDTNAPESVPDNDSTSREYGLQKNPSANPFDKIWGTPNQEDSLGPNEVPSPEDELITHRPKTKISVMKTSSSRLPFKNRVANALFELAQADESPLEEKKVAATNVKQ